MKSWSPALRVVWQVGLLTLVSLAGNALTAWREWPVPGNLVGLLLMVLLLQTRLVRLEWVASGADWLTGRMLLFFIPATVGIIHYKGLLAERGLHLMAIIITSTFMVMTVTGLAVDWLAHRHRAGRQGHGAL